MEEIKIDKRTFSNELTELVLELGDIRKVSHKKDKKGRVYYAEGKKVFRIRTTYPEDLFYKYVESP